MAIRPQESGDDRVSFIEKVFYLGAALGCFGMALFGHNLFWGGSKARSETLRESSFSRLRTVLGRLLFLAGGLWILYEGFAH